MSKLMFCDWKKERSSTSEAMQVGSQPDQRKTPMC